MGDGMPRSCSFLRLLAAATLVACGPGCRVPRQVELLQREVRRRDERIFELEYQLQQYESSYLSPGSSPISNYPSGLDAIFGGGSTNDWAPRSADTYESTPSEPMQSAPRNAAPGSSAPSPRFGDPPSTTPRDPGPVDDPGLRVPEFDLGDDPEQLTQLPGFDRHRRLPTQFDPRAPERIVVNELLTTGYLHGSRGGVRLACELRDGAGRPVHRPGEFQVRLMDAERPGEPLAVRRFGARASAAAWRETPLGPTLFLDTDVPRGASAVRYLQVEVDYVANDGRVLRDRSRIDLTAQAREDLAPFTRTGGEQVAPAEPPRWSPRRD